jgi:hypothetical protein
LLVKIRKLPVAYMIENLDSLPKNRVDTATTSDLQQTYEAIVQNLSQEFQFTPHKGLLLLLDIDRNKEILRSFYKAQNIPTEEILINMNAQTVNRIAGFARVLHDDDVRISGIDAKYDYIIFLPSKEIDSVEVLVILAEETMHAEHELLNIKEQHVNPTLYDKNFSLLTKEALGYLARIPILDKQNLKKFISPHCGASQNTEEFDLAHIIGYAAIDDLSENGCTFPYKDLFHAECQERFWSIIQQNMKTPVEINLIFVQTPNDLQSRETALKLVTSSHADDVIRFTFQTKSYSFLNRIAYFSPLQKWFSKK